MSRMIELPVAANPRWKKNFDPKKQYFETVCDFAKVILPSTGQPMTAIQLKAHVEGIGQREGVESAQLKGSVLTIKPDRPITGVGRGSKVSKKEKI